MKVVFNQKKVVKFGSLLTGEVFTVVNNPNDMVIYMKIPSVYHLDSSMCESLLEGCCESDELDECAVNAVNIREGTMTYFPPSKDVYKCEAEVIVHN